MLGYIAVQFWNSKSLPGAPNNGLRSAEVSDIRKRTKCYLCLSACGTEASGVCTHPKETTCMGRISHRASTHMPSRVRTHQSSQQEMPRVLVHYWRREPLCTRHHVLRHQFHIGHYRGAVDRRLFCHVALAFPIRIVVEKVEIAWRVRRVVSEHVEYMSKNLRVCSPVCRHRRGHAVPDEL
jgi:hypothetical protein